MKRAGLTVGVVLVLALGAVAFAVRDRGMAQASFRSVVDQAGPLSVERVRSLSSGEADLFVNFASPVRGLLPLKRIELGVTGVVEGYAEGPRRTEFQGDPGGRSTVMAIKIISVLKGGVARGNVVYAEIPSGAAPDRATQAVPRGTPVVLLAEPADPADQFDPGTFAAGRPVGANLWLPAAQGLIVSNGPQRGVTYPLAGFADGRADLVDLVASSSR